MDLSQHTGHVSQREKFNSTVNEVAFFIKSFLSGVTPFLAQLNILSLSTFYKAHEIDH
ncbi:hypothetical protein BMQ_pBM70074 (plasmid) [Priestia megaterium QM B1551]|uniref:Uncharacterized protein n=1 Tax=Priestia megaterium (strain ATCC 12872 / QMB1551) TaxID=545693 RepID=D5E491_PRIM1|nr:hypothetical protein BMQ_pBM70074 [Priestia megaterium QM B1551]